MRLNERNRSILVVAAVLGMFLGACGEISNEVGETVALHVDEITYYDSYHRLAEDSDVVVMGIVESLELGRLVNASGHEEESSTQYLDVVIQVEDVMFGRLAKRAVVVEWSGWWVDGLTGEAGPRLSTNGLVPHVGDSMIWFLVDDKRGHDYLPDTSGTATSGSVSMVFSGWTTDSCTPTSMEKVDWRTL